MKEKPNVLMIMTDQHHAGCLGYAGHPDVKTPHIDRLAAEGVRFDECFAANGVCVPSRVSFLTGEYCHTHGVYGNDLDDIPDALLSLARYLQYYGYQTGIIGKKHLPNWKSHGFQYERLCYHADAPVRNLHYYNYLKKHNLHGLYDDLGDVEKFCLSENPHVPVEHSLEVWTADETIRYLRDERNGEKPFFLQVSFERPHPPLTVPAGCPFTYDPDSLTLPENREELPLNSTFFFDRNVELKWCTSVHGEKTLRVALAAYYAIISLIDDQIGRILACVDEMGLRDDTIIVFTSDHGDFAGEYSKMAKGWHYDCIHRVPFVWNWQGVFPLSKVYDELVETVDFFPTICSLLRLPVPKTVQGKNISGMILGTERTERESIFYEFVGVKTVRTKDYKLNYGLVGEGEVGELFDLINDPHEYENLFDSPGMAPVRETLLRKLLDWIISTQQPPNFGPGAEKLPSTRWFDNHDCDVAPA